MKFFNPTTLRWVSLKELSELSSTPISLRQDYDGTTATTEQDDGRARKVDAYYEIF